MKLVQNEWQLSVVIELSPLTLTQFNMGVHIHRMRMNWIFMIINSEFSLYEKSPKKNLIHLNLLNEEA